MYFEWTKPTTSAVTLHVSESEDEDEDEEDDDEEMGKSVLFSNVSKPFFGHIFYIYVFDFQCFQKAPISKLPQRKCIRQVLLIDLLCLSLFRCTDGIAKRRFMRAFTSILVKVFIY